MSNMTRDWSPFDIVSAGERLPDTRPIESLEGMGDRLRTAAFAELQAREAFLWAADRFTDGPSGLCDAWRKLAAEEQKHMDWLMVRMKELGTDIRERKVSDMLWKSLITCTTARDFTAFIATAEERGRKAGVRFRQAMAKADLVTAKIFGKIAEEEVSHIEIATSFFGPEVLARAGSQLSPLGSSTRAGN